MGLNLMQLVVHEGDFTCVMSVSFYSAGSGELPDILD